MEITLTPDIEKALAEQARRQGATPEMLALDVFRERFVSSGAPEMGMNEEATLADFLAGHIGVIASSEKVPGGAQMSEDTGSLLLPRSRYVF